MLGPKQVANPDEHDNLSQLERWIDSQLAAGSRLVQVASDRSESDWNELLKRYRAIGWKVSAAPGSEFAVFSEP